MRGSTFTVSMIWEELNYFSTSFEGGQLHGANLSIQTQLKEFARRPEVTALEVFLPPGVIANRPRLEEAAKSILPPERMGKGILRFLPITSLPEIWADGEERILWCRDPWWIPRDRYLRDKYAVGPTPLLIDTHSQGQHGLGEKLAQLAGIPDAPHDTVCALTPTFAEGLRRHFTRWLTPGKEPPFSTRILPHSVDTTQFQPVDDSARAMARRTLGLPEEGVHATYFGRLTPNSKADLLPLIRCFHEVASQDLHLVIGGVENIPGYVARLQKEALDLDLQKQIHFLPELTPTLRHLPYAAADFFVFPGDTVQEAMANTLLEALASGLPLLISDWDGMKDVSVDGVTGFHVPTYWMPGLDRTSELSPALPQMTTYLMLAQSVWVDTAVMTQRLEELFANQELRDEMGRASRSRAEDLYSADSIWEQTTAIWRDALETARGESEASRNARRTSADQVGHPMPLLDLFEGYSTSTVDIQTGQLAVTPFGRQVIAGEKELTFYDETLPLIHPKSLSVLKSFRSEETVSIRDLAAKMEKESGQKFGDCLFLIGLLLKRGVFRYEDKDNYS